MKKYNLILDKKNIKLFVITLFLISVNIISSQIKIGDSPQELFSSSLLELQSKTKTFVLTRLTTSEMIDIEPLRGSLVYNIDEQCVFYYNGTEWSNLCAVENGLSLIDNGNDTYTVNDGINPQFTFDVGSESISTLINNEDGSYTYTDELDVATVFKIGSITNNNDGTFTGVDTNGENVVFNGATETITTMVDNGNGSFTYTNEADTEVIITSAGGGVAHTGMNGSVFFAGDNSLPTENNSQLFWDNDLNRLGIGTNSDLNDNLNVNGTIGVGDGSVDNPSYRFLQDGSLGIFRNLKGHLAFSGNGEEKISVDGIGGVLVNNANSFSNSPLVVRGKGPSQQLLTFQDANQGISLFSWDFRYPGLNLDEVNKGSRLFIKVNGFMGIDNPDPTESLDIDGTFRVRQLPVSPGGLRAVVVDDNGVFYQSTTLLTGKQLVEDSYINTMGRWYNANKKAKQMVSKDKIPLFGLEDFKDHDNLVYLANKHSLKVMQSGRYDIKANISLLLKNKNGSDANLVVRIVINDKPIGATVNVNNINQLNSSLFLSELLQLNTGDEISLDITISGQSLVAYLDTAGKSNFSIIKLK